MKDSKNAPRHNDIADAKIQFGEIVSLLPTGVFVVNADEDVVYANPAAERLFGDMRAADTPYRCGDLISCKNRTVPAGCGHSSDCPDCPLLTALRTIMTARGKRAASGEAALRRDNAPGPLWVKYQAQGLEVGGEAFVLFTIADITPSKTQHQQLSESEARYRSVLETINEGVVLQAASGEILTWNKGAEEIFGLSAEQTVGRVSARMGWPTIHEDGSNYEFGDYPSQRTLQTGTPCRNELMGVVHPSGKVRWISINTNPLFSRGSDTPHAVAISFIDITDRRRAEREYQMLFREMLDGFALHEIICDDGGTPVDYRFVDVNPAFEKMTGLKADQIVGHTVLEVLPGTEPHWIDTYGRVALTAEPAFFENYTDALKKHFQVTAFCPREGQFACIFTDITARKQAEMEREKLQAQLTQAQKMEAVGNLAGGIAHDFNNILFPIIGMSELLLEDLPRGSIESENAREIFRAGKRGSDLVKQILAFSRQSEQQKLPIRPQQVLKEVVRLMHSTIPSSVEIKASLQSDCGLVMADPTQLHQVAMNLITNAYHALAHDNGVISVRLAETEVAAETSGDEGPDPGRYAVLTVADTGSGIPSQLMRKIFEPYFTTKPQGKGTGLGLAVAYGIIKDHGGEITVDSTVGEGSAFSVYLPLLARETTALPHEINGAVPTGTERILLVDDEAPIVQLEKKMLERLGYRVAARVSSLEALQAFQAAPDAYDVLITDMTMPAMTGDQLAKAVKAIRPDIPVIICTGFSERIDPQKAAAIGINGFLMKPAVKSEMAKMIRKVLDASNASGQK